MFITGSDKMKKFIHRCTNREDGQAMVEFALSLPIILILLCGIIDFGWVGFNMLTLQNVTREGVRSGIVVSDVVSNNAKVSQRIRDMAPDYVKDSVEIYITYSDPVNFKSGDITVVTKYRLKTITPFSGIFTKNGEFALEAECTMKMS